MTREGRVAERRLRAQALRATLSALGRRREGWEWGFIRERWGFVPADVASAATGHPVIWISSAPGGELIQTYSLCRRLKEALPDFRIFLSTTNARSLGFARAVPGTDGVFFSPWDLQGPVRRALRTLGPRLVVAMEAALDPILYREARRLGATTMLASGYMTHGYHGHPTYERSTALGVFDHLDWIGAKSDEDRRGFIELGVPPERVVVLGDLRYDAEYLEVSEAERAGWREILGLASGETLLVAGSVRAGEEEIVTDGFLEARRSLPELRLLIAPRFPQEAELVATALRSRGEEFCRRTELRGGPSRGVLILDSFGELARLYSLASFVFLGGSIFPQDRVGLGQNMIEPLAHGVPIFFGPHMNHWADIVASMVAVYQGLSVTGAGELARGIVELHRRPDLAGRLQALARKVMEERSGGLQEHVAFIQKLLTGERE
jgi:3-deoxy-D-manno-octulosonic-acid transferase